MNFMQPWMLMALPLVLLPIVIHLVNQRRFQTVPWAAMRFLLEASKMSSGYTKLRQWLILALRTLALAALVFFTARPLTSGIMALLGGDSNRMAIVILDRSPSMSEVTPGARGSKLELAIDQLAETFTTLGIQRVVELNPLTDKPEEFPSVTQWLRATPRQTWSATTDIPGLMEQALVYAKNNRVGNTLVWLCSDLRESDWRSKDGRWKAVQDGFKALPQDVRFSVLDLSQPGELNRSIRVTSSQRVEGDQGPELSISFRIDQWSPSGAEATPSQTVPVEISVGGNRSVLQVDLQGKTSQVNDYRLPLEVSRDDPNAARRGWGAVRLPSDTNPADDKGYFVFEQPPTRRTVIVSETPEIIAAIELCASIAPQQSVRCEAEQVSVRQLDGLDWNGIALVVWHESLPVGKPLEMLERFVASGGQLLLLPPESPNDHRAFGVQWTTWEPVTPNPVADDESDETALSGPAMARIAQWQNDSQLLANTLNGAPLPLGQLGIRRICKIDGPVTPLASLPDGIPILAKIDTWSPKGTMSPGSETIDSDTSSAATGSRTTSTENALGGSNDRQEMALANTDDPLGAALVPPTVTLCATTPSDRDSTLAGDGVVLYVTIQRLLDTGSKRVGTARNAVAGSEHRMVDETAAIAAGSESASSNEYAMHAGVYQSGDWLVALHRNPDEDETRAVDEAGLDRMFGALPWAKIGAGKTATSLVQEIWRWFVVAMIVALLLEAALCLPRLQRKATILPRGNLLQSAA
jgi:hypothetical protein